MHSLAEICIRRPVFASMLVLALVVVGAAAYLGLGVDRFPSVDLPTVLGPHVAARRLARGGRGRRSAERIEEAVNTVEGISRAALDLRPGHRPSSSPPSTSTATSTPPRRTCATASPRCSPAAARRAPAGHRQVRQRLDAGPDDRAVGQPLGPRADRARRQGRARSSSSARAGVGEVAIVGGQERAINIWVDADRLAAYGIPITAVRDALVRQNADVPGGNVTADRAGARRCARWAAFAEPRDFDDLRDHDRRRRAGAASATSAAPRTAPRSSASLARLERHADGDPGGAPAVGRQHGRGHRGRQGRTCARVQAQLPARRASCEVIRDQSRYIYAALHEINLHLVLGSILACLVVLAFMRSWRSTIIAGVAIPASVIATFGMMWALDFTLNSVTMLALVLMVGIVIDDAIVVLENIFRFVEEKKMDAVRRGHGGDGGDRPAGAGDHALAWSSSSSRSRSCRASRALPLPVRHHGGGRDPGQPAGLASRSRR